MVGVKFGCLPCISIYLSMMSVLASTNNSPWIQYPDDGTATMTHYDLPSGFVAACGCTGNSTNYPTAALSQMAYGSSADYGTACGRCFNLTLLHPVFASPPFNPPVVKYIVVKITDLCPLSKTGYCSGTNAKPNVLGSYLNFDLAFPSKAIPDDFFPSNETLYGYTDFGVWNITYQSVSCANWAGANDSSALGSVGPLEVGACCPADPNPDNSTSLCPSYSDDHGISPYSSANGCSSLVAPSYSHMLLWLVMLFWTIP